MTDLTTRMLICRTFLEYRGSTNEAARPRDPRPDITATLRHTLRPSRRNGRNASSYRLHHHPTRRSRGSSRQPPLRNQDSRETNCPAPASAIRARPRSGRAVPVQRTRVGFLGDILGDAD